MELIITTSNNYFTEEIMQRIEGGIVVVSFDMAKKLPRLKLNTSVYCLINLNQNIQEYDGKNIMTIIRDIKDIPKDRPMFILDLFHETFQKIYLISMDKEYKQDEVYNEKRYT